MSYDYSLFDTVTSFQNKELLAVIFVRGRYFLLPFLTISVPPKPSLTHYAKVTTYLTCYLMNSRSLTSSCTEKLW